MKKRERQRSVAMVTEIWLLFKNLECRWWCDECVSVCVLLLPHRSLSVSHTSAVDPFCVQQGRQRRRPEGGVPGHMRRPLCLVEVGFSVVMISRRPTPALN